MDVRRTLLPLLAGLAFVVSPLAPAQGGTGTPPPSTTPPASQPAPFNAEAKERLIKRISDIITENAFVPGVDFDQWTDLLAKHRERMDAAETPDAFTGAVNRALREFKFSHIVLMSPRSTEARVRREGIGIGVNIMPDKDGLLVTRTIKGAPADVAGIVPGDILMEADGKKLTGTDALRGEEGTKVTVKIRRDDGTEKDVVLERKKFSTAVPEELTWPTVDTAVLKVPTFDVSYNAKQVEKLVSQAQAGNAKSLVLDLRGNGGGAVMNVLHLLGLVLPQDSDIGTFVNRRNARTWVENGGDINDLQGIANSVTRKLRPSRPQIQRFSGNVAVLIDGGSGSASEIAAAAVREVMGGPVVGTKSAGAVLASVIAPIGNGFSLQYPIYDYVTIKGLRLEGAGVVPDVEAQSPLFLRRGEKDPAVVSALNALSARSGRT